MVEEQNETPKISLDELKKLNIVTEGAGNFPKADMNLEAFVETVKALKKPIPVIIEQAGSIFTTRKGFDMFTLYLKLENVERAFVNEWVEKEVQGENGTYTRRDPKIDDLEDPVLQVVKDFTGILSVPISLGNAEEKEGIGLAYYVGPGAKSYSILFEVLTQLGLVLEPGKPFLLPKLIDTKDFEGLQFSITKGKSSKGNDMIKVV